jgi:hypothetical protein
MVNVDSACFRFETFFRECVMTVTNSMKVDRFPAFVRLIAENVRPIMANYESRALARKCNDNAKADTVIKKSREFFRNVKEIVTDLDYQEFKLLIMRSIQEAIGVSHTLRNWGIFIRSIKNNAESEAETKHKGAYYRKQSDKVQAAGLVFRGLFIFVRIVAEVFIRDFILRRFLKARSELVLKSCVVREIVLDSKLS